MTNATILTVEELNMLYIVKGGSRTETIDNIFDMLPDIDDEDIRKITESALERYRICPMRILTVSTSRTVLPGTRADKWL